MFRFFAPLCQDGTDNLQKLNHTCQRGQSSNDLICLHHFSKSQKRLGIPNDYLKSVFVSLTQGMFIVDSYFVCRLILHLFLMDHRRGNCYLCQPLAFRNFIRKFLSRFPLVQMEKLVFFLCKYLANFNLDHRCCQVIHEHFEF